jgi:hypothetical protein
MLKAAAKKKSMDANNPRCLAPEEQASTLYAICHSKPPHSHPFPKLMQEQYKQNEMV